MSPGNQLADGALARIEGFTPNGRQKTDELVLAGDIGVQDLEPVLAAIASRDLPDRKQAGRGLLSWPMPQSFFTRVGSLSIHALRAGDPSLPPLICLHGWPTNASLYRHLLPALASDRHVVAVDLPGFGKSDGPPGRFSFRYLDGFLSELMNELGFDEVGLVVHDLGGPIGLHWAVHHPERVQELIVLNTLAYPKFHWAVALFVAGLKLPLSHRFLTSPRGVEMAMRFGVQNKHLITPEVARLYSEPCRDPERQRLLRRSGSQLSLSGFKRIAAGLPKLAHVPSALVYGERDRILPDVAKTMARLHAVWPRSMLQAIPDAGHFLQEDRPEALAEVLQAFARGVPRA